MATKRMKHDNGMEQVQEPKAGFEDRISELPDAILIHILSFLPTLNVIRMSLLSKRWRSLWTSVPALDFMDSRDIPYFRSLQDKNKGDERKKFCKFIDESLRHLDADTNLSTFKLCMKYHSGCGPQLNGWFRFLEKKNVKELDFCILPGSRRFGHCLPSSLPGLRALSFLKLSGLVLETLVPTSLPFLEELHLEKIKMNDRVLNNLMLSCPTLAKLHLDHCCGFSNPKVSSSSLKSMEFAISSLEPYSCCRIIKVEAINLHSFAYRGGFRHKNYSAHLVPCRTIRNLSLSKAFLTDQQLEDLIPELPLLEHLKLTYCYGFQHINIRNQHLKHFVLRITNHFEEATIDTPNLVSFSCSACLMRKISVDAPSLLNANITIYSTGRKFYDVKWHTDLIKFLSQFKSSKSVGLTVVDEMALIVPDELRKMYSSPLPICKHMKLWIWSPLCRNAMLRKSLLWIAPSIKTCALG